MNYLQAINLDLQEQGLNSELVEDDFTDGEHIIVMLGGIRLRIDQSGDSITMNKYRVRAPRKPIQPGFIVGHPYFEWEQYWERSYELADPHSFEHAMKLITRWANENATTQDLGNH